MGRYECTLRPDLLERAVQTLNEPRENQLRLKAIDQLRGSFNVKKYGPLLRCDDEFILRFLRSRKFNHKKSLKCLHKYHSIRKKFPEVFLKVDDPSTLKHVMESGVVYVNSEKSKNGETVVIYRPTPLYKDISLYDVVAYCVVCAEKVLEDEEAQICGTILIDDLEHFKLRLFQEVPSRCFKLMSQVWQEAMPVRLNATHICNEAKIYDAMFEFAKAFLHSKMRKSIHFHGSKVSKIHADIDPATLPSFLGGSGPSSETATTTWIKKLME